MPFFRPDNFSLMAGVRDCLHLSSGVQRPLLGQFISSSRALSLFKNILTPRHWPHNVFLLSAVVAAFYCCWGFSGKRLPEGGLSERQNPSRVGGKDLEERTRTSKDVLSSHIEPEASPQSVFAWLRIIFTKGIQWVCGGVEQIGVGLQQRGVTSSKARKDDVAEALTWEEPYLCWSLEGRLQQICRHVQK